MDKRQENIVIKVEETNTGFSSYAVNYAIYSTGKTFPDLINNFLEAANLYFDEVDYYVNEKSLIIS